MASAAGAAIRVVLTACQRPMFWVFGRPGAGLAAGARIASFPAGSPPGAMVRALVEESGLDPAADLELLGARDDLARLGLLRSGDVDLAVVSSASIEAVRAEAELVEVADVGSSLPLPSTGLAVGEQLAGEEPDLVARVVGAQRRGLRDLYERPDSARVAMRRGFGWTESAATSFLERARGRFTADGRCDLALAQEAIERIGGLLEPLDGKRLRRLYGEGADS